MLAPNDAADLLNYIAKDISPELLLDFKPRPQQSLIVTAYLRLTDEITIEVKTLGGSGQGNTELFRARRDAAIDRIIKMLKQSKLK